MVALYVDAAFPDFGTVRLPVFGNSGSRRDLIRLPRFGRLPARRKRNPALRALAAPE